MGGRGLGGRVGLIVVLRGARHRVGRTPSVGRCLGILGIWRRISRIHVAMRDALRCCMWVVLMPGGMA